jgi:hypothetical protein
VLLLLLLLMMMILDLAIEPTRGACVAALLQAKHMQYQTNTVPLRSTAAK